MTRKRLLLISPRNNIADYTDANPTWIFRKKGVFLNAGLATVAALTPSEYRVEILDENVEAVDCSAPYDLVGITGFNSHLPRARQLARAFRRRGVPVVCGGPSVSLSPERWRPFADVLIIGEAERIWPRFCKDFLNAGHVAEYREEQPIDLSRSPLPDYRAMSASARANYLIGVVQTSRGCPYDCEFCSVHVYLGHRMRYKSIAQILAELNQVYALGLRMVFLADDNFYGGRKQSREILAAVRDWNHARRNPISLVTQLSIDAAKDNDFLKLASEAGLRMVYVGIESPNPESLQESHKLHNLCADMERSLKNFSAFGIMVIGSTIVGFDHDDLSIFRKQFDFFNAGQVPSIHVYPLPALDATRLKQRIIAEGRYLDWEEQLPKAGDEAADYNNFDSFRIEPRQRTVEQLRQGLYWLAWNLYDLERVADRTLAMFAAFDANPEAAGLRFPRRGLTLEGLKAIVRVIRYFLSAAPVRERRISRRLLRRVRTTGFPRPLEAVLGNSFRQVCAGNAAETAPERGRTGISSVNRARAAARSDGGNSRSNAVPAAARPPLTPGRRRPPHRTAAEGRTRMQWAAPPSASNGWGSSSRVVGGARWTR